MKRLTTVLIAGLLLMAMPATSASANNVHRHRRVMQCHDIRWENGPGKVADFIRCASRTWDAPGSPDYAVAIARCESGLEPTANNGSHGGLFQHALSAWPGRWRKYLRPLGFNDDRWANGELNAIAAMRMAKADGTWSRQWSCA